MNFCFFAVPETEHAGIQQTILQLVWQVDGNSDYCVEHAGTHLDRMVAIRTISGNGELTTTDGTWLLTEKSLCIIPLSRVRAYRTMGSRWNFFWMEFTSAQLDLTCMRDIPVDETEYCLLHDLAAALAAEETPLAQLNFRYLLGRWIYKSDDHDADLASQTARLINASPVDAMLDLQDLLNQFGVSERTLRKRFQEAFGLSPQQYALDRRLKLVKVLLRTTTMRLKEIAAKTGFQNEYYLSSCFKRHFGVSPSAYRLQEHKAPF